MLLVCGEALFDVFIRDSAGGAVSLDARAGGSPYNVAIGLSRLGRDTAFLGAVSSDMLGQALVDHLVSEGVSERFVVRKPELTTLGMVGLAADGSARYSFYNEKSADTRLLPADLPVLDEAVRAVHVGSFSMVVDPTGATLEKFLARDGGNRLLSYDPNVRPRLVPDRETWRAKLERLSRHIHLLKMSDEDFAWLFPGGSASECAREWLANGVRLVVMTEGAGGAVSWSTAGEVRIPGIAVDVVDTVGAGDTFQAALLCGLDEAGITASPAAWTPERDFVGSLMQFAARAAAVTCSRRGADLPRRAEVDYELSGATEGNDG